MTPLGVPFFVSRTQINTYSMGVKETLEALRSLEVVQDVNENGYLTCIKELHIIELCLLLNESVSSGLRTLVERKFSACYDRVLSKPDTVFFQRTKMSKSTFFQLAELIKPYFDRISHTRGPKPAPLFYVFLYRVRFLAHGLTSWSQISVD